MTDQKAIAKLLDHSVLKPNATEKEVVEGCEIARRYATATICVRPTDLQLTATEMSGSTVQLCTVIGFPHGSSSTASKLAEVEECLRWGARELDVVINIGQLLSGNDTFVKNELKILTDTVHEANGSIKIIFENCYLTDQQIMDMCVMCTDLGVDWVKSSTGFGSSGATEHTIALMRKYSGRAVNVKASGGIRSLESVLLYKNLGCNRIGTSSTEKIMKSLVL